MPNSNFDAFTRPGVFNRQDVPQTGSRMAPEGIEPDEDYVLPREETANEGFLAWEKFRLAYNLILFVIVLVTLVATGKIATLGIDECLQILAGAFLANVCFCVGPWIEGWIALAGANRSVVRWGLVVVGTPLACFLAFAVTLNLPLR